jgi:hypothetical protein
MLSRSVGLVVTVKRVLGEETHALALSRWTPAKYTNSRKFKVDIFAKTRCYERVQGRANTLV